MKKLLVIGILFITFSGISFVLAGIYYQVNQDGIQKMKDMSFQNPGSSYPFISNIPDSLRPDRDVIYGLILLPIGIGITIASKYLK